ncbi:uncharacterized protein LOC111339505 isoform X1 [Stylophora pistillata]|uniref:uncharacterized protein LOC111339505 isoform X1 n=1 Tax=Stylophora pistillata TaxID=50429 RepID=UPI000C0557A1|nr:uncharacterized protein LOC111339505 isoform X1 [Stylophora pistillata]
MEAYFGLATTTERVQPYELQDLSKPDLEKEIQQLQQRHERELAKKNEEVKHFAERLNASEKKVASKEEFCKRLNYEKEKLNNKFTKEIKAKENQLNDSRKRLALSFEKRLKQDQRRVQNFVESNTPSDIEKDFQEFFDGERLDAYDDIEFVLSPSGENDVKIYYPRLACLIFEIAYEQVKEARDASCDLFQNITGQLIKEAPRMCQEMCHARKSGASAQLQETFNLLPGRKNKGTSTDVLDGMMLSLKENSHLSDLKCFEEDVKESVREQWKKLASKTERSFLPTPSEDVLTRLGDYIKACIRLTWRIVTQVPPMQLEYKAVQFDNNLHKLARFQQRVEYFRGADQLSGKVIACYLWPALLEAGGRIIFPAEVMCERDYVVISKPLTP